MIKISSAGVSYSDSSEVEMNKVTGDMNMYVEMEIDRQKLIRLTSRVNLNLNSSGSGSPR